MTRGNKMEFFNNMIASNLRRNPIAFLNSFSRNVGALPCARYLKKHFLINRSTVANIFLDLISTFMEIPEPLTIQWEILEGGVDEVVYAEYTNGDHIIHINPDEVRNPRVLLNVLFHEIAHVLTNRISILDSIHHGPNFDRCYATVIERFQGVPIERNVDLWVNL